MRSVHPLGHACVAVVEGAHPADRDRAASLIREDLGCVEVKAMVPLGEVVERDGVDVDDLLVRGKREVPRLPEILPTIALGGKPLGADCQKLPVSHAYDVGTLPHVAKDQVCHRRVLGQNGATQPPALAFVVGVVDEHTAKVASSIGIVCVERPPLSGAQQHVQAAVLFPDLRVAHMQGTACGVIRISEKCLLGREVQAVLARGHDLVGLSPPVHALVVEGVDDVSRVEHAHEVTAVRRAALVHPGAAREDAAAVELDVRRECHPQILPADEVVAHHMTPVLELVRRPVGSVLVVGVIASAKLAEAVGVVEPALSWLDVKRRVPELLGHRSPQKRTRCWVLGNGSEKCR